MGIVDQKQKTLIGQGVSDTAKKLSLLSKKKAVHLSWEWRTNNATSR